MISKLLSGAVKLYLRSQVERVENLEVKISGKSKQILQGHIPQVFLSCDRAVYQGLHLSQVRLNGTNIAVNLPEVIKQKPLQLIEPIVVEIQLKLNAADLQASWDSDLLRSGLSDLWQMILAAQIDSDYGKLANFTVDWQSITIAAEELNLGGVYQNALGETNKIVCSTKIDLANQHTLCLSALNITSESLLDSNLDSYLEIDLGTDVAIEQLIIESEQILCSGTIRINS